ncbi:MAG: hypothetical protein ISR98_02180 [Parcubacteria group bacterium]|nr:hypothetical protein [Parcubacteria group bacterium]
MTTVDLIKELKKHNKENVFLELLDKEGNTIYFDNFKIYSNNENETFIQPNELTKITE